MEKADYIFTHTITDNEDFLQKCINLDQEIKDALFDSGSISEGMNFINFLQMNYTNNEIIGIFKSIEQIESSLTQSGMKFFRSINERVVFNNFKKVKNNFIVLFSEFIRLKTIEADWLKNNVSLYHPYYPINSTDYNAIRKMR